jgi:hypothetical protein
LNAAEGVDARNSHQFAVCDPQPGVSTIGSEQ